MSEVVEFLNRRIAKARDFLRSRAQSYRLTFDKGNAANVAVLVDLAKFCRAHVSTANQDPIVMALLEGRRDVWLRVQQHLKLDDDTLWMIYGGKQET